MNMNIITMMAVAVDMIMNMNIIITTMATVAADMTTSMTITSILHKGESFGSPFFLFTLKTET